MTDITFKFKLRIFYLQCFFFAANHYGYFCENGKYPVPRSFIKSKQLLYDRKYGRFFLILEVIDLLYAKHYAREESCIFLSLASGSSIAYSLNTNKLHGQIFPVRVDIETVRVPKKNADLLSMPVRVWGSHATY